MIEYLQQHRSAVERGLREFLESDRNDLNLWSQDVRERVLEYALRGKMIRGSLVFAGGLLVQSSLYEGSSHALREAAVAMELFQSFLLIHDDIMDNDDIRRGLPAVHAQYRRIGTEANWQENERTALALGICAGDITGFWAVQLLSEIELDPVRYASMLKIASREIALVGAAQMQDVVHGAAVDEPSVDDILSVYRYKTGRYTFSLPLMLGWVIAGGSEQQLPLIADLGESLGVAFQIQDDYLGLFGDTEVTGKPVTSDIAENKKTLYRRFLREALLDPSQSSRVPHDFRGQNLLAYFGSSSVDAEAVARIRTACQRYGVVDRVGGLRDEHAERCHSIIDDLSRTAAPGSAKVLRDLVVYIGSRGS